MLKTYLDDLERRIDPESEEELETSWRQFLAGECPTQCFCPQRRKAAPPRVEWPKIPINEVFEDLEKMLIRELKMSSDVLAEGSGAILNIRSNYGTGIMPSLFGTEIFFMDQSHDTLPTAVPLPDGTDGIRRLLDAGIPDLDRGLAPKVFESAAFYEEQLKHYPKIREYVRHYHPDLQGPVDVAEVVWGSGIFMEFYDHPELVKSFLQLVTETYERFMRRWLAEFPGVPGRFRSHWGIGHRGQILLRDDSAMNLSPEMYAEFVLPFDRKLLAEFGGGVVHFCGKGDHYIDQLAAVPELTGIQMSQPEYNDMEVIYRNTVDRGIPLLSLPAAEVDRALAAGRNLRGMVHDGRCRC